MMPIWDYRRNDGWSKNTDIHKRLKDRPDQEDWEESLRSIGFTTQHLDLGKQFCQVQITVHESELGEFLIDIWSFDHGIAMVFCPEFPDLIHFLKEYAPLFQIGPIEQIRDFAQTVESVLFDERFGLEVVQRVHSARAHESARLRRQYQENAK